MNVLIIEDNASNAYLVGYLLASRGHTHEVAPTVREGLALATRAAWDVIVLDLHLPDGGGEAVARALRGASPPVGTPIVAVTSYALASDREIAFAAGCNAYLEKPLDTERFTAELESWGRAGG
mgnify:CR=1 FL=1